MTDKEKIRAEIERRIYRNKRNKVFEDVPEKRHQLIIEGQLLGELKHFINSMQEESVSESLEEAATDFAEGEWEGIHDNDGNPLYDQEYVEYSFKADAQWQKEQFEKNRLKHCNSITNEQAELEQGFVDQHLDKYQRIPTFLDAIEYGMRLQKEQMMAKAIDGDITFDYFGDDDKTYGCIAHDSFCLEDLGLKDTDKVKMIIIKEG